MHHPVTRKPGELAFAAFLTLASLFLLYDAYGISGFQALSAPGAIPMAATLAMAISAGIVLIRTARSTPENSSHFGRDILPARILVIGLLLIVYAFALQPVGFLPTSAVFLVLAVKYLSTRSWGFAIGVSLFSLLLIYLIFRIVFTVLMPTGIVPEGEMLAWLRNLTGGSN
jgi:hypothetical protein